MKKITQKLKTIIEVLLNELEENSRESKINKLKGDSLRQQLREAVLGYELNRLTKSSTYIPLDNGKSLVLTTPAKTMNVDPEALRAEVGDEIFHELCNIVEIEFDMEKWAEYRDMELVYDSQLKRAIKKEDERPVTVRVSVKATKDLNDEQ